MDLSNVDLLSLQSRFMRKDPTTIALSQALNPQFQQLAQEVKLCQIYKRLMPKEQWVTISPGLVVKALVFEQLDEKLLDELAWQLRVDWYDATSTPDIKQKIIQNAILVHMYRGTPYAVEQVIQTYFGDGYVLEWFDYGGEPGMFKVVTNNSSVTAELANQFIKVLNSVKNVRSHLEEILISLSGEMDLYLAGVVHTGDFMEVRQVV